MKMKFAFCLFRYFPFGGLQRDFLRIARACLERGHKIDVYTLAWEGPKEEGLNIHIISVSGWQNHIRTRHFAQQVQRLLLKSKYDAVVGFNRMPGLDIYYAADVCYQSLIKQNRRWWYRLLPRYQQYLSAEAKIFTTNTQILILSSLQQNEYSRCYQTPLQQFYLLPPGIAQDRLAPEDADDIRKKVRDSFNITNENVLLLVGSGFKTKGLDRVLQGIAALPADLQREIRLWVVGQDNPQFFIKLAKKLKINHLISFFGGRHDVGHFFLGADLLVHPARHENTGTVLLEALAAGLPVLTVNTCGYAHFILEANAGKILTTPFNQGSFNKALHTMLVTPKKTWRQNGFNFAKSADIYSLPEKAATFIENFAQRRNTQPNNPVKTEGSFSSYLYKVPFDYLPKNFADFMHLTGETFRQQKGRKTQRVILDNKAYFIKQHLGVGWLEIIKNLIQLRLPIISAKNEWEAIYRLQKLGINTPVVAAYGTRGINPAARQSFILMEELASTVSLEDFCRDWKVNQPAFSLKLQLLKQVANIAKTMHENGINHRDFYLCHFLLKTQTPLPKLYVIDLHRAGLHRKLPTRWIIKDLAGLYFSSRHIGLSQRDLFRFMKVYRQSPLRGIIATESRFWQKVVARGEKLHDAHAPPI